MAGIKDTAAASLKAKGFDAANIDGVIMIQMPYTGNIAFNDFRKRIAMALSDIGYGASWGIRAGFSSVIGSDFDEACKGESADFTADIDDGQLSFL